MPNSHFNRLKEDLGPVEDHLSDHLFDPLHEFLTRPRPFSRGPLVTLGFELAGGSQPTDEERDLLQRASQALESLHAGALIVEEALDESETRQGLPCLHVEIGTPLALNAGAWLHFFSHKLLLEAEVAAGLKNFCLHEVTETLLKLHQARALNLSARMSQQMLSDAPLICRQSLEWRSGALFELGLILGARAAGCEGPRLEALRMLGRELGVALQMFEDLASLQSEEPQEEDLEALFLQRPSFVWWLIAEEFPEQWGAFKEAVMALPESDSLRFFLDLNPVLPKGRARALGHQQWTFQNYAALGGDLTAAAFQKIEALAEKMAESRQES